MSKQDKLITIDQNDFTDLEKGYPNLKTLYIKTEDPRKPIDLLEIKELKHSKLEQLYLSNTKISLKNSDLPNLKELVNECSEIDYTNFDISTLYKFYPGDDYFELFKLDKLGNLKLVQLNERNDDNNDYFEPVDYFSLKSQIDIYGEVDLTGERGTKLLEIFDCVNIDSDYLPCLDEVEFGKTKSITIDMSGFGEEKEDYKNYIDFIHNLGKQTFVKIIKTKDEIRIERLL